MKTVMKYQLLTTSRIYFLFFFSMLLANLCHGATKTSIASGSWNTATVWSPGGVPAATDNVIIASGHTITVSSDQSVKTLTVNAGGNLTWSNNKTLTLLGNFTVNGTVIMKGGNISMLNMGLPFIMGANASFTWDPGANTVGGATLFTKGTESFAATSLLIIKNWYDYSVPIGSVVSGNFGNLELNSLKGNSIKEWNQNNTFEAHQVIGTLTIDQGWITLDKSGSILNTTIGKIVLKNVNSSFYGHNGTHPGSFTITTSSVTNNGGNFFGINDGNGNVLIHVAGNFTNIGNTKIINNSGVSGVSNGNATFIVDSTYTQSTGDTRFIYNVSSYNSGLYTASFRNVNLSGGIFMGQTGCRTAGGVCSLTVLQNLTINFSNITDKFRGTSISSISSYINNVQLNVLIGGNLTINGNISAEMTSSASSGVESFVVTGNTNIQGCTVSFNYGAANAAHSHSLSLNQNVVINGGTTFFSRNNGSSNINVGGNLTIVTGWLTVKGADSLTVFNVAGNFSQTGGTFYLHNNSTAASISSVNMSVSGDFSQSAGLFSFESNTSNTSSTHTLSVMGTKFNISGTGIINHSLAGTGLVFGVINFNRAGIISYSRSGSHSISQVKQVVKNNCTVNVVAGNFQVASHSSPATDYLKVEAGGILDVSNKQIYSNGLFTYSGIKIDSSGKIRTQLMPGFYDSTSTACINANNNLDFFLHTYSIVEYYGPGDQILSSNGHGAIPTQHQYGILRINLNDPSTVISMIGDVIVRTNLQLNNGEVSLNGNTIIVNNGSATAVTRINGYINGELNAKSLAGKFVWKNVTTGNYEFPFGTNVSEYIPVIFTPTSGSGSAVSISTYSTKTSNNNPFPVASSGTVNFSSFGSSFADLSAIDRWWTINATGIKANVTLSYRASENTLESTLRTCSLNVLQWNSSGWNISPITSLGVITGIGRASVSNTSSFSVWAVAHTAFGSSCRTIVPVFNAELIDNAVSLTWNSATATNDEIFTVERSSDGVQFEEIKSVKGAGNSATSLNYSVVDEHPLDGTSYYRLKLTDSKGGVTYSELRTINFNESLANNVSIESFGPNPFSDNFWISYKITKQGTVAFQLSSSSGQIISSSQVDESAGEHKYEFNNGASLPQGIYFLKIIFGDKVITQKMLKK